MVGLHPSSSNGLSRKNFKMPAKVKSTAVLAKEAADAAASAALGSHDDSFVDAEDGVTTGISKDLLAYI